MNARARLALNVSHEYVLVLLDNGALPFHADGENRRIRSADLLAYKTKDDVERDAALAKLTVEAERLGLGY